MIEDDGQYLYVFNAACLDIAREEYQLSEADFLKLISEHELYKEPDFEDFFKELAAEVKKEFFDEPTVIYEGKKQSEQQLIR